MRIYICIILIVYSMVRSNGKLKSYPGINSPEDRMLLLLRDDIKRSVDWFQYWRYNLMVSTAQFPSLAHIGFEFSVTKYSMRSISLEANINEKDFRSVSTYVFVYIGVWCLPSKTGSAVGHRPQISGFKFWTSYVSPYHIIFRDCGNHLTYSIYTATLFHLHFC